MALLSSIFVALLVLSALVSALTAGYVYREHSDTVGARWLLLLLVGQTLWSGSYALQLPIGGVEWWFLWERVLATGVVAGTVGLFVFVLRYTGYDRRIPRLGVAGALSPFALTVLLAWTNQYHGLVWGPTATHTVVDAPIGRYVTFDAGPWLDVWIGYSYLVVFLAVLMLGATYVRSRSLHRAQVGLLFLATLIPWVGNAVFTLVDASTLALDVTPMLFTATGLLIVVAVTQYRMLASVPVSEHALLEQLSEGIVVTDETGEILHCNQIAADMFGGDIVGTDVDEWVPDPAHRSGDANGDDGDELVVEMAGTQRYFDVEREPYADQRGIERGAIYHFQDITERRERAEALARRNDQLDRFARTVSHDLRNPIEVATAGVELARRDCESPHLDDIEDALDRMDTLIEDVLTLARQGQPISEPTPVSLSSVTTRCWDLVTTPTATVTVEEDLEFLADPERLQQLLENLFRNAIDHGGSDVTVRVGALSEGTGFYVADDGPGIPQGKRGEIFGSGYTTTGDGTGFGLAIVENIAEAHGWTIGVTDSAGGGARFEISGVETPDV